MEFQPINTQEEFDARIADRLKRERDKFADYDALKANAAESGKRISELEAKEKELTGRIRQYETDSAKTRIGLAAGLPHEMISRLSGTTEEEIKTDAEALAKLLKPRQLQPLYQPENNGGGSGKDAALLATLQKLRNR